MRVGLGGGCHWCTEAVFQSLLGIENVKQGWIASVENNDTFSEAVIVEFNPKIMTLQTLIEIHLHTHKSTSNHSMRNKYRSAIYYFDTTQKNNVVEVLNALQHDFGNKIITQILPYHSFKPSREAITNYYYNNPKKPFCEQFINPKLKLLLKKFSKYTDREKLQFLHYN